VKKPIEADLILSSPDLKALMVVESMTCCGRRFHLSVTRSEKKWRLRSSRHLFFIILAVCPLVTVLLLNVNMLLKLVVDHPLYILNTSSRSARFLLSSNDHKLRESSRFAYDNCLRLGIILVKRC